MTYCVIWYIFEKSYNQDRKYDPMKYLLKTLLMFSFSLLNVNNWIKEIKQTIFFVTILFSGITYSDAQEITLFNNNGKAIAYIAYEEDATIFLWNGTPIAFLESDSGDMCLFGYNGNFLGWYEDGIVYDKKGYAVGAREGAVNMSTQIEPIKGIQEITPIKPITLITPIKPIWKNSWSSTPLIEFLYSGKY